MWHMFAYTTRIYDEWGKTTVLTDWCQKETAVKPLNSTLTVKYPTHFVPGRHLHCAQCSWTTTLPQTTSFLKTKIWKNLAFVSHPCGCWTSVFILSKLSSPEGAIVQALRAQAVHAHAGPGPTTHPMPGRMSALDREYSYIPLETWWLQQLGT